MLSSVKQQDKLKTIVVDARSTSIAQHQAVIKGSSTSVF